jgi:hypothetical protein
MSEPTDQPTPNVALLRKTLEHIENHPQEWNQGTWHCGTIACFAGHAVIIDGGQFADDWRAPFVAERPDDPGDAFREFGCGAGQIHIADRARHVLGLTQAEADDLFAAANTLDDLREQVARLIDQADVIAAGQPAGGAR